MSFVHLQVRSAYSLLKSTINIDSLIMKTKELGFKSIALTDENVMYGIIDFYKQCKKHGIKPIIGLTASVIENEDSKPFQLVLLAKNNEGYHNLLKISSVIQTKSLKGIPKKWLKHYVKGLIALSPGLDGEVEYYLQQNLPTKAYEIASYYKNLFDENSYYFTIQNHGLNEEIKLTDQLILLANELRVDIVATNHVSYLEKLDSFSHQCLLAIKDGIKLEDKQNEMAVNDQYYLKSQQEMEDLFQSNPQSLINTWKIADQCHVEIELGRTILPKYPVPNQQTAFEYLKLQCEDGLKNRVSKVTNQYTERLVYELSIIDKMGFSDYFLIVWDFMKFAHRNKILTGPGRGSAAGSLVAFVLHITDIDPLKHNLLFERFLNPERVSMPDIDIDFPDNRREEIIEYVAEKYGELHVAQIITFGTFGAKAAIRDIGRIMGVSLKEVDYFTKLIPGFGVTLKDAYHTSSALREYINKSPIIKKIFSTALKLEGLPRHTSTHAAGVIISEKPLTEVIPIQRGHNHIYLTQYAMGELEEVGLIKMDFLGLRNLTLIENIISTIKKATGKQMNLQAIPVDDMKTFQLLSNGDTTGVFQLESEGIKKVLQQLKPSEFEDIVAVNALYRPGPMENIPMYIDRKHKRQPISFPHPDLEQILDKTYGVIVYQEQIIQIAAKMANFSLGEADLLRRAIGKKKKEILDQERNHFLNGCTANHYPVDVANEIYDLIVRFANYGFNRSHAVAYSFIAYQLAYLKTNYPLFFYAGLLTSVLGNEEKTALYIKEARQRGIKLYPPSINKSSLQFRVENGGIRYSLLAIKSVGGTTVKEILEKRKQRPFSDLFDLCVRTSTKIMNRKVLESLVYSGALDEFGEDRAVLLASIDIAIDHADLFAPSNYSQIDLFKPDEFNVKPKYIMDKPLKEDEKLKFEKEVLGLYLSSHPISRFSHLFRKYRSTDIESLHKISEATKLVVGAYISSAKTIRTKKGEAMSFFTISDETGDIDAVAFPAVYTQYISLLNVGDIVLLEGSIEKRQNKRQFVIKKVSDVKKLEEDLLNNLTLYLKIESQAYKQINLIDLKNTLKRYPGNCQVIVYYEKDQRKFILPEEFSVNPSQEFLQLLKNIIGENNVVLK